MTAHGSAPTFPQRPCSHKERSATTEGRAAAPGLKALAFEYLEDLEIRGRADLTAKRYGAYLDTFVEWLSFQTGSTPDELRIQDVTDERLRAYRLFLARRRDPRSGKPIGPGTRNLYQVALRNLLRYCGRQRHLPVPDAEATLTLAKERDIEIRHLQRDEVVRLRDAVDPKRPNGLRDRTIVETLFGTGVRVSELAALTRRQVDLKRREVEVVGKGGHSRLVIVTKEAADWIARYLATRTDDHPALFVTPYGGSLNALGVRSIEKIVERAALRAALPFRVSPHWLRHSRLTALARHAGVQVAQRIAGHASLATTSRYLHVTDTQLRELYDKADQADREA